MASSKERACFAGCVKESEGISIVHDLCCRMVGIGLELVMPKKAKLPNVCKAPPASLDPTYDLHA